MTKEEIYRQLHDMGLDENNFDYVLWNYDSIDTMQTTLDLENKFKIELDDSDLLNVNTYDQLINLIQDKISESYEHFT